MTALSTAQPYAGSTRRERVGWYFYSFADHAFFTTMLAVFIGPYLTSLAKHAADADGRVHPLGIPVAAGSYYPYLIAVSVLLSVLVLPLVGAVADRSAHRKWLLAGVAFAGVRQLRRTLAQLRAYPLTLLFLLAFLVYNDGVQTVIALASTYGTQELQLSDATLAVTILIVQFVAFGGALLLGFVAS